jgi:hypothetical protein
LKRCARLGIHPPSYSWTEDRSPPSSAAHSRRGGLKQSFQRRREPIDCWPHR